MNEAVRPGMKYSARFCVALVVIAMLAMAAGAVHAAPTVAGATNLVLAENGGRIVAFSSQMLDENNQPVAQWSIGNLIDGLHVTETFTPAASYGWRSRVVPSPSAPEWVVLAFKDDQTRLISRAVIDPTTDDPEFLGRWAKDIKISVSTTNPDGPFRTVGNYLLMRKGIQQTFDFVPTEARYVKVEATGNWGSDFCVEMGEVEVYEAIVGDDVLDELINRMENLLMDLKRYRDSKRYQNMQTTTEAVTAPPVQPADGANQ